MVELSTARNLVTAVTLAAAWCVSLVLAENVSAAEPAGDLDAASGSAQSSVAPATEVSKSGPSQEQLAACVSSHEEAQVHRLEADLLHAAEAVAKCAQDACPQAIREDCLEWKEQIQKSTPSLLVRVMTEEGEEAGAMILVDGREVSPQGGGRVVSVNPGLRVVAVRLRDGRGAEKQVLVPESEKSRQIIFDLRVPAEEAIPTIPEKEEETWLVERPIPVVSYALGGAGLVSAGLSIGFGVDALNQEAKAEASCAPLCSEEVTRVVRSRVVASSVFLGVSLASFSGAIITYALRPEVRVPLEVRSVAIEPRGSGATLKVRGRF